MNSKRHKTGIKIVVRLLKIKYLNKIKSKRHKNGIKIVVKKCRKKVILEQGGRYKIIFPLYICLTLNN